MNISFTIVNFILVGIAICAVDNVRADGVDPCENDYSCCLSQANSNSNSKNCPSACNSFYSGQNDTVCFHNKGNDQIGDNVSNGPIKIGGTINSDGEVVGGEVVNTTSLQICAKGCNGSESGAPKLHAGVVGVLLGSIALAFMS